MKILSVCSSLRFRHGGSTKAVLELSGQLNKMYEHDLLIIGVNESKEFAKFHISSFLNNDYGFPSIRLIKSMKYMDNYDLIICHGFYLFTTLAALLFSRKRIWIIIHGGLDEIDKETHRHLKRLFKFVFRNVARKRDVRLIGTSNIELKYIKENFPGMSAIHLPLGIELSNYPNNCSPLKKDKRKLDSDFIGLVSISRISRKKRIELIIEAIHILKDEFSSLRLIIAGDGEKEYLDFLRKQVRKFELNNKIEFVGWINEEQKLFIYETYSLFILPSDSENYGYAVAEAIVNGMPVVVSDRVSLSEAIEQFGFGKVVNALDAQGVALGIREAILNLDTYRQNCRTNGTALSWEQSIEKWKRAIEKIEC